MSTTLTKDIRKHIQYKITAKKQGYYEKQITQTFTEDNPVLDLGDLTPYDGLKYKADNSVPNYRTTTLDFSETVLPFADNTKQNLKMTKYCLHDYRYKYKIPEYRGYSISGSGHFGTVGQGPKVNMESTISNNQYYYDFDPINFLRQDFSNTDTIYSINSLFKFKYKKSSKGNRLFYYNDQHSIDIGKTDNLIYVGFNHGTTVLEENKDYWIQVLTTKTHITVKLSTDGTNYNTEIDKNANVSFSNGVYFIGSYTSNNIFGGYIYYNASSVVVRWGTGVPSDTVTTYNIFPNYIKKEIDGTFTTSDLRNYRTSIKNNVFIYPPEDEKYTAMGFQTKCRVSKGEDFKVSFSNTKASSCPLEIKGLLRIWPYGSNNKVVYYYKTSKDGSFIMLNTTLQNKNDVQNFIVKFKDTGISIGYCTGSGSTNYTYTDITDAWYEENEYNLIVHGGYTDNGASIIPISVPMEIDLSGIPELPYVSEICQGILYNFEKMNVGSNYSCYCDSNRRVVLVDTASIDESIYTNIGTVNLDKVTQNDDDQIVGNLVIDLDV